MKRMHIAFAFLSTLLLLLSLAYWQINMLLLPVVGIAQYNGVNYAKKEIVIPLNYSAADIAVLLEEEGIIKSALLFQLYARYHGYDQHLQAGRYMLNPAMGLADILEELKQGVVFKETRRFTIPEGFTMEQIAARLDAAGLAAADLFKEASRQYYNDNFAFLDEIPAGVYHRLEGYLFPDTYEVFPESNADDIITIMLQRFAGVFNERYRSRAAELGLTIHEAITLASLIEREGRVREEKPLIAAVFHNRLKQNMLLQSCATVQYALGEIRAFLTYADLEIDSPYNTYLYPGLPPGPIASPSLYALRAALYPAPEDYLYFVSREDGSGAHYFSTTLQEHNRYKALAEHNRKKYLQHGRE
ncbi:MAG TPA: endolytic transglycosylase MltG [Firmicutes bacterium]|nr:endolytic transglycosylase MltG [Bacillota bacterium]